MLLVGFFYSRHPRTLRQFSGCLSSRCRTTLLFFLASDRHLRHCGFPADPLLGVVRSFSCLRAGGAFSFAVFFDHFFGLFSSSSALLLLAPSLRLTTSEISAWAVRSEPTSFRDSLRATHTLVARRTSCIASLHTCTSHAAHIPLPCDKAPVFSLHNCRSTSD